MIISGVAMVLSPWLGSIGFVLFALDGPLTRLLRGADAPTSTPASTSEAASRDGGGSDGMSEGAGRLVG